MRRFSCVPMLLVCLAGAASGGQDRVRLRLVSGAPVIDEVYVNGTGPFSFIIDTGAERSIISEELARQVGLQAVFRAPSVTQTNEIIRDGFVAARVRIRGMESRDEEFLAGSFAAVRQLDRRIQGILGQTFLSKLDYLIDFRRKAVTFGITTPRGGVKAPFAIAHGCMVTPTNHGQLTLDSGASTLVLYDGNEVRWKKEVSIATNEGQARVRYGALQVLRVAGQEFRNVETLAAGRPKERETGSDGLLPANLFRSVYVSNSGGYVVFNGGQ